MVLSKMDPSTASTMRSMIAEGIVEWRWLWWCRPITISAWTCLRLLCECENVSRLWMLERVYGSYASARTCLGCECLNVCSYGKSMNSYDNMNSYGKSKPYGWLAQVYIFGCEWPSELQNSAVQIPGVMGYCGKYAQKWTRTLIMLSSPQEWICRHRKCVCKLFDTNCVYANCLIRIQLNWPKRLFPCLTVRQ